MRGVPQMRCAEWNPWLCYCTLCKVLTEMCINCMAWQGSNLATLNSCGNRHTVPRLWELSEAQWHPALPSTQQPLVHSSLADLLVNFSFNFPLSRIMPPPWKQTCSSLLQSKQTGKGKGSFPPKWWDGILMLFILYPNLRMAESQKIAMCAQLCKLQQRVVIFNLPSSPSHNPRRLHPSSW